ncbi:related to Ribonuclease H [Sporisorium reilianum f. sp. reilianum]|uniref:ribonuclease H n=1 Tax=Sporisorium reilianum f. sp. reilianum TaxID=72559 RepID=A0A2N8UBD9_9BASI|nr:related to Ribonuclease H [Sporisorium reilianum f. sp. reilianum]
MYRSFDEYDIRPDTYRKYIFVYCDGSCLGNGKPWARAGYAAYFPDPRLRDRNVAARLQGLQTNNRAELMALIRAVQQAPKDGRQVVIFSDSEYAINCVGKWLGKWRSNGWKTAKGKPVANRDLVRLDRALDDHDIPPILEHVKGHAGHYGNEVADQMAKEACYMYHPFM